MSSFFKQLHARHQLNGVQLCAIIVSQYKYTCPWKDKQLHEDQAALKTSLGQHSGKKIKYQSRSYSKFPTSSGAPFQPLLKTGKNMARLLLEEAKSLGKEGISRRRNQYKSIQYTQVGEYPAHELP